MGVERIYKSIDALTLPPTSPPYPPHEGEGKTLRLIKRRAHPRYHVGRRVGERRDRGLDLLAGERIDFETDLGGVRS